MIMLPVVFSSENAYHSFKAPISELISFANWIDYKIHITTRAEAGKQIPIASDVNTMRKLNKKKKHSFSTVQKHKTV